MSDPINHHYVPQHFLEGWSVGQKQVNRYRRIDHTGEINFKKNVGIKKVASEDNLYVIEDEHGKAEFEKDLVTALLDEPGAVVVKKIRDSGYDSLSSTEREIFARYVVMLEARNPSAIAAMAHSPQEFAATRQNLQQEIGNSVALQEVAAFMSRINPGKMAAGLVIAHDTAFSDILLRQKPIAVRPDKRLLVSSDYPTGRWGSYESRFIVTLAVSPGYGLLWSNLPAIVVQLETLRADQLASFINLLTLGRARVAFTNQSEPDPFVRENLGWQIGRCPEGQQGYMTTVLDAICAQPT